MDSKRELYKVRTRKGQGDRAVRAKLKEDERKTRRDNLLLSKRRIPLSAIQESPRKEEAAEISVKQKKQDRLERLKEWKKQREEAKKKKEQESKKKPFWARSKGQNKHSFNFQPAVTLPKPNSSEKIGKPSSSEKIAKSRSSEKIAKPSSSEKIGKPSSSEKIAKPSSSEKIGKPSSSEKIAKSRSSERIGKSSSSEKLGKKPSVPTYAAHKSNASANPQKTKPTATTHNKNAASSSTQKYAVTSKPSAAVSGAKVTQRPYRRSPLAARASTRQPPPSKAVTRSANINKNQRDSRTSKSSAKKVTSTSKELPTKKKSSAQKMRKSGTAKKTSKDKVSPIDYSSPEEKEGTSSDQSSSEARCLSDPPQPVVADPRTAHISTRDNTHVIFPVIEFVNDPAWIPGAKIDTPKHFPNFDSEFCSTFSPFQFTGARTPKHWNQTPKQQRVPFNFSKKITTTPLSFVKDLIPPSEANMSTDSLADNTEVEVIMPVTPKESSLIKARNSLSQLCLSTGRAKNRSLVIEVVTDSEEDCCKMRLEMDEEGPLGTGGEREAMGRDPGDKASPNVAEDNKGSPTNSAPSHSPPASSDSSAEPAKPEIDISYFRGLHSDVISQLTSLCQEWEGKSAALEERGEGEEVSEDVMGQIRTTVCQAQLLMSKKMKQYLGLVEMAGVQSGGQKTTAEDLQGFWDMVYFQVEDVLRKFEYLTELEKNEWKAPTEKKTKTQRRKKQAPVTAKTSDKSSEASDRLQAAREKREAARNRLREMRAAAKKAQEQVDSSPLIVDMAPSPKRSKEDTPTSNSSRRRSTRKTPSKYKHRRTSMTLINFDVILPQGEEAPLADPTPTPSGSGFSPLMEKQFPTVQTSCSSAKDVPTAKLLSFTPGKVTWTPRKTPRKTPEGASIRRFVSITPSKKLQELLDAEMIMSPARRSLRLAEKGVKCLAERMVVSSLMDMPDGVNFAYCPNAALM